MMDEKQGADLPPDMVQWLNALPPDERQDMKRTWMLSGTAASSTTSSPQTEEQLTDLLAQIDTGTTPQPEKPEPEKPQPKDRSPEQRQRFRWGTLVNGRRAGIAIGAALAVILSVSWLLTPVTTVAPRGEQVSTTLPDGSVVELSSGSSLSHRRGFLSGGRRVHLDGEAFFTVQPGDRPFRVETFNAEVEVVGTRFNVRAFGSAHRPSTEVAVEEGTVQFRGADGKSGEAVKIGAGRASRLPRGATRPSPASSVDVRRQTAWRFGGIAFVNEPLADIVADIERRYDVDIRLEASGYQDRRLTLYRSQVGSARGIVEDLCGYFAFECTLSEQRFILRSPSGASNPSD